jgi:hypothetical protein
MVKQQISYSLLTCQYNIKIAQTPSNFQATSEQEEFRPQGRCAFKTAGGFILPPAQNEPQESASPDSEDVKARKPRTERIVLPITFGTEMGLFNALTCADTGSDVNIVSVEVAQALGQNIREDTVTDESFVLANGRIVRPLGKVMLDLRIGHHFDVEDSEDMASFPFYVFPKAAAIIVGMPFLDETRVMTANRNVLRKISRLNAQSISVCSIGRPKKHLLCEVNHELTIATPDSGSEIDLMSPKFAADRGFTIHNTLESVELADGTVASCNGFVRTTLSIGSHFDSAGAPRSKTAAIIDFFLLEGLNHDVIIGDYHLEHLRVFTDNRHALILTAQENTIAEINSIRRHGTIDNAISWVKRKLGSDKVAATEQQGKANFSVQVLSN